MVTDPYEPSCSPHPQEGNRPPRPMRVAVLSSGGKDSAAAWWWAACRGWTVDCLVTVMVEGEDSPMFQIPSTHFVERQAELAGIDWVSVVVDGTVPHDITALENALKDRDIDGFVSGALRSDYQKSRLELMAHRLGLRSWTPLWHQSGHEHVASMIENGFEIMLTSVSAEGLDPTWLGRVLDSNSFAMMADLAAKHRFHVEGEGGEYETLVLAGPHHPGRLQVEYSVEWDGVRGHLDFH